MKRDTLHSSWWIAGTLAAMLVMCMGSMASAAVTITPSTATVAVGGQQTFAGSGGVAPYAFVLTNDTTGGASIGFLTGLYTAGPNPGTSTVHMADSSA